MISSTDIPKEKFLFNDVKEIIDKISECTKRVKAKEIPLSELAFNVMISKAPKEYVKTVPQHIRAARQLNLYEK